MQTQRVKPQQNQYSQQNRNKEGEVRIDSTHSSNKSHFKPGDGEYVDYEEVK